MDKIYNSKWISAKGSAGNAVFEYSKRFFARKKIKKATLCSSAIGVYTAKINGADAGVYPLAPGWTMYQYRVQYQKNDVSSLIKEGENVISLSVGRGFLCQAVSHDGTPRALLTGLDPSGTAVICSLDLLYDDGSTENISTDETWLVGQTKWRSCDMYDGDVYDSTFIPPSPVSASVLPAGTDTLVFQDGCEIGEHERFGVKEVILTPRGETVLDFGQNITGYLQIKVRATAGVCRLTYGEVLDKDGNFYRDNYRAAKAQTTIICGGGEFVFKPEFTFYGFRYVRVDEWNGELVPDDICAVAVYSNMERIGNFHCSHDGLNKLYENVIWGQKGNFLDVPTDCPQRDERMGWTGDAQVFSSCAAKNFDVLRFFEKWLSDMRACQKDDGRIPVVVPSYWARTSAAWSDACVIIPYNLYMQYGDERIISDNYDMMRRWIDYLRNNFDDYIADKRHFGDWLALDVPDEYSGKTPKEFIAVAFCARSTKLFIEMSKILGKECEKYSEFYDFCRDVIRRDFSDESAYQASHGDSSLFTQTYYVLRLSFGLYDSDGERAELSEKLNDMVLSCGTHLTTGFVGTPYLLFALSDNGYVKTAYSLLLRKEYPSWLYQVSRGATTMWEHWDGIKENGDLWDEKMNSFNHYAYGSVGDWMYSVMAGIKPTRAGYGEVVFEPAVDERISSVSASIKTPHGTLISKWEICAHDVKFTFTVPENVPASAVIFGEKYKLSAGENVIDVKLQ